MQQIEKTVFGIKKPLLEKEERELQKSQIDENGRTC